MLVTKTVYAPAKINLCLHVLGKRADGYHALAMLMQRVTLFDRIEISLREDAVIEAFCPGLALASDEENIAARAAKMLFSHVGQPDRGVRITIDKSIPAAAGLGGGSSDAAAVLLGLQEMLDLQLPKSELMTIGLQLGADVPFFLYEKTAWATGVGEVLQEWSGMPPVWFVLVNPGIAVSTAGVFQNLGLTHTRAEAKIPRFPVGPEELVRILHNDLESVTCTRHPVVELIKQKLLECGAQGALMSGSGPTVFGVFPDQADAERVARVLEEETGWWTAAVSPL
jgi:4-diphosphocytidyl-2-C-methyl-D-erythritol kinase